MKRLLACLMMLAMASCTRDYDVELPKAEQELVIEAYLEDGSPMRALVTYSTALLDPGTIPPSPNRATVTITHAGKIDTLQPAIEYDSTYRKAYNYTSNSIVVADYQAGAPYRIDVWDSEGRHAYGETRFMQPVAITSLTPIFRPLGDAYCLTSIADNRAEKNYYRLILTENAVNDSVRQDILLDESSVNDAGDIVTSSGYFLDHGSRLYAQLFHLPPEHHLFLTTTQNATGALVNPFSASGEVVSNIRGGRGIFAALTSTRKSLIVP
jgi:hypothetical protein